MKSRLSLVDDRKTEAIALKVSRQDKAAIEALAQQFAHGNLAKWVRYASLNFRPTPADLGHSENSKPHEEENHG